MSHDSRESQSKFDRPAATPSDLSLPARPAATPRSQTPAPAQPPVASPAAGQRWHLAERSSVTGSSRADDARAQTFVEWLRGLPPAPIILTIGSVGSLLFLLRAMTSHTTPVAVLMSAGVVTGLIFGVDAVIASVATWRFSQDEDSGRALLMALAGGIAYLVSFTAFAGVVVMILVLNSAP